MKIVYTDWSCLWNPWKWWRAWVCDWESCCWHCQNTTNNEMELTAILKALENHDWDIDIRSDSIYAINVIQGIWYPSKNIELINQIRTLIEDRIIIFTKVKAHNWDKQNERADKLACAAANLICDAI